ncbi:hypothetical protein D3C79_1059020 [compost metagenome]
MGRSLPAERDMALIAVWSFWRNRRCNLEGVMLAFHQRCEVPHVGARPAEPGTGHIRGHLLRQRLERRVHQIVRVQELLFV